MRRFTRLYDELDRTTRTSEKEAALVSYFSEAPPRDAAWALYVLTGHKLMRGISTRSLREVAAEEADLPLWLVDESHVAVGDLSETLALLLPETTADGADEPLHRVIEERLLPLAHCSVEERAERIRAVWQTFSARQRFVFHKLISGVFRVGVARKLVVRALARVANVSPAVMDHRLLGHWKPTADDFARIIRPTSDDAPDPAQPYPFCLAYPLDDPPETLGERSAWRAEWKWDGIRAQLIRRDELCLLWSRGEEQIGDQFPEIRVAGQGLPPGTVLDGEILAWEENAPLPFNLLQRRIGRKLVDPLLWQDVPVVFIAFDLLEDGGADVRPQALDARRARLEALLGALSAEDAALLRTMPELAIDDWPAVAALRDAAREHGAEGLMLKRRSAAYGVGRARGDWWKWKIAPYTVDAVLIYAQGGSGRRASLFTDYTFAVRDGDELVPVAKAYSGLTDAEIRQVDRFVRENSLGRRGPVTSVKPELVFELAFEGIQESSRHKAGLALRFPRMARWRHDKKPADADTLDSLRRLLAATGGERRK